MPICTDKACEQAGIEQPVESFVKNGKRLKMCQSC